MTMNHPPALGIDMAKRAFDAALLFDAQRTVQARFDNTPAGMRKLQGWLHQHFAGKVRAAVESTSGYAEALLQFLFAQGHEVFLLNPERVAHYGRCLGQRNKTDPADARTIAAFIAHHQASPWRPPSAEQKTLRELTRTRSQLVEAKRRLANQLPNSGPRGAAHLQAIVDQIKAELRKIDRQIAEHLREHPNLAQPVHRLMSVKGVGQLTAAVMIAELPPISPATDPRTIASWAGLTPRRRQSGNKQWRTILSRKGNWFVRQALYMPALVAKRHNPLLRSFAQRLAQRGKSTPAILGAISHKMLRILVGLLRTNSDFDPNWSFKKA